MSVYPQAMAVETGVAIKPNPVTDSVIEVEVVAILAK